MSTILTRIFQIRKILGESRHIPWVKTPPPGPNTTVLFQRSPPWWARWAHALVAVDVMIMGSIVEYTWDLGGFLRHAPKAKVETSSAEPTEKVPETLPLQIHESLQEKSVTKKVFFSGLYVISGVVFAAGILASRARILRAVTVRKGDPRSKTPTKFYLQTASHPGANAVAFPSSVCSLIQGDMPSRLFLRVQGHGAWTLILKGAYVHQKEAGSKLEEVPRTAMLRAWRNAGGWIEPVDS